MKIRIKGNSVRYRLTKSDIAQLGSGSFLKDKTEFASKTLHYAITITDDEHLSSDFTGDKIQLNMPRKMIEELINTEKVGFMDQSRRVSLLVEKDFACLDNAEEDQSDNFPNPLLTC